MKNPLSFLYQALHEILADVLKYETNLQSIEWVPCRKEFDGEYTFVCFNVAKSLSKAPDLIASWVGEELLARRYILKYNVVKGFLNITLKDDYWIEQMNLLQTERIEDRIKIKDHKKYLIEYCSPNTNKPLHLGHIRNILIGWSIYKILKALGHDVSTTQVINDRGIAICKSMLAWKLYANGNTPEKSDIKGDHFVGDYYVLFEKKFKEEFIDWQQSEQGLEIYSFKKKPVETPSEFFSRFKNDYFNQYSLLGKSAKQMLLQWEAGDSEILHLWNMMNSWVYDGFEKTFKKLGVKFDSYYYESKTYLLGKDIVEKGLKDKVFEKEADNSIWVDLTVDGLDRKIVMRSDGTSVYITQDLGTIELRHSIHHADQYIYVVADEQDYHFHVLKAILKKLKLSYAEGINHLNYGMVELPTGRMKSREGTVVDADELIDEVILEASNSAMERGELSELSTLEKNEIVTKIAMSALKYFILKVQAKKKMIFNPVESVDMQGHTGPYISNAYVRIQSILRRQKQTNLTNPIVQKIEPSEKNLLRHCLDYPNVLEEAGKQLDPAHLANYLYQLAKDFHKYYHDYRILNAESEELIQWRLNLCSIIGLHLSHGMNCLGIELPDRM